ncbi:MAG: hypothetical protein R6W77_01715 [Trueperaceae bacterium]
MRRFGRLIAFLVPLILFATSCSTYPGETLVIDPTPWDAHVTVLRAIDGALVHDGFGAVTLTGLATGDYVVAIGDGDDRTVGIVSLPAEGFADLATLKAKPVPKATGTVEIVFPGKGGSDDAADRLAFAVIEWFDFGTSGDRGLFRYLVTALDGTMHREIVATVTGHPKTGVAIAYLDGTAWFVGEVVSDVRAGGGHDGSGDGHDGGEHDAGGGCGGEEGHDEGGCGGGEEGHDEGGCSGGHGEGETAQPSGSGSRVGQFVAVKVHDGGTPATDGDAIAWKWFTAESAPDIVDTVAWPALCAKTIIGGNLVVRR